MRYLILATLFLLTLSAHATPSSSAELLKQSQQLLLVRTPNWDADNGSLQVYQRSKPGLSWEKHGAPIPVVVGVHGLGWGVELTHKHWPGPIKKEGDNRSPVGIFKLGPIFGFNSEPGDQIKLDYLPLTATTVCVDDVKSQYYNQLLDSSSVQKPDWHSAEQMREVPVYYWGSVIQYNNEQPVRGAGSCIFLHIWRGVPGQGTAGCVALDETQLQALLAELRPEQKPVLALVSEPAYEWMRKEMDLP